MKINKAWQDIGLDRERREELISIYFSIKKNNKVSCMLKELGSREDLSNKDCLYLGMVINNGLYMDNDPTYYQ